MQELARYWATGYDWHRCETKLNALPHFITEIHGLDIHFIHVRSPHENALPVIIAHGWPGSVIELLAVIDPLTNPTAHGGSAADAFDVVIPSMPGYGYSGKPQQAGSWMGDLPFPSGLDHGRHIPADQVADLGVADGPFQAVANLR
jgi:pimeloyl-ACP methyl ester carboxylesterase